MTPNFHTRRIRRIHSHLTFGMLGLFLILISNDFLSEGISQVGLENAVIAKNIDRYDIQHFWDGDNELLPANRDYMPLGYYMEGQLMKLAGDSRLFEKLLSMILFLVCSCLLVHVWHLMGKDWRTAWVPLGSWLLVPVVTQTAVQNTFELPVAIFSLAAVSSMVRLYNYRTEVMCHHAAHPRDPLPDMRWRSILYNLLAAFWLMCAFYVKGLTAMYLLLFPIVFWFWGQEESPGSPFESFFLLLGFTTLWILLACSMHPDVRIATQLYLNYQIGNVLHPSFALSNFWIYLEGIKQMAIGFGVMAGVWIYSITQGMYGNYMAYWKHKDKLKDYEYNNVKNSYRFFTLGILGIIPCLFAREPHGYYLVPMIPFLALGISHVAHNTLVRITNRTTNLINNLLAVCAVAILVIGVALNFNSIDRMSQDENLLGDLHEMLPLLKEGETVSVSPEVYHNDAARAYFLRYKNVAFDTVINHNFLITSSTGMKGLMTNHLYQERRLAVHHYRLYEQVDESQYDQGSWDFVSFLDAET